MAGPGPEKTKPAEQERKRQERERTERKKMETTDDTAVRDTLRTRRKERGGTLSEAEKRERKRIFEPAFGVGHAHGSADAAPGHLERWWKNLSPSDRAALQNPANTLRLTSLRSRSGSDDVNMKLAKEAGTRLEDRLRREFGVTAKIDKIPLGEELAARTGSPNHRDNCKDRVTMMDIERADERSDEGGKETPEARARATERDEKRREIPERYRDDYKLSREKATNVLDISLTRIRMGFKRGPGFVIEAFRQINDAVRYRHEMERAPNADHKLWGVRPMRGFVFELEKPSFRDRIHSLLRDGGYDTDVMYREYLIHWLRKGAK